MNLPQQHQHDESQRQRGLLDAKIAGERDFGGEPAWVGRINQIFITADERWKRRQQEFTRNWNSPETHQQTSHRFTQQLARWEAEDETKRLMEEGGEA